MKKTTGLMAGASRFAHFAGLTRTARKGAAQDDTADDRDEDDDKNASEDDDEADDAPKGKRSRNASDDDDDDDGKDADDGNDDADDDAPKGKRGRKAEDDDDGKNAEDDDSDEMKGKGAVAQARRREQARISHILGHKAAAGNPLLAVSLACETRMTRREAVAVLKNQPQQASEERGNRHARSDRQLRNTNLGSDASAPSGRQAIDASWGAAFKKAGVKPR